MRKLSIIILFLIVVMFGCDLKNSEQAEVPLIFNPNYQIKDSALVSNFTKYIKEVNVKYPNTTGEYRFWEFYILHATSYYTKILIKNCNYELLSTATGYFTIGKDVFFLHTGLELIAEKDTSFVYNVVKANTKAKYKLIDKFTIPKTDSTMNREFILIADTIIINYQN